MRALVEATRRLPADDTLSPELALVDPELASRARALLPERAPWPPRTVGARRPPGGVVATEPRRLTRLVVVTPDVAEPVDAVDPTPAVSPEGVRNGVPSSTTSPPFAAHAAAAPRIEPLPGVEPRLVPDDVVEAATRRLARGALDEPDVDSAPEPARRLRLAAGLAACCAAFALALFATDRALDRDAVPVANPSPALGSQEPEAGADPLVQEPTPTTAPPAGDESAPASGDTATPPQSRTTPRPPSPAPVPEAPISRRFAWAPVDGASGYHLELFRDGARVFAADTTRPAATVPAEWTFEGRRHRLEPATYRWYVWPVVSGRREPKAVVRAVLVVAES